jgi:hypothetical protein
MWMNSFMNNRVFRVLSCVNLSQRKHKLFLVRSFLVGIENFSEKSKKYFLQGYSRLLTTIH